MKPQEFANLMRICPCRKRERDECENCRTYVVITLNDGGEVRGEVRSIVDEALMLVNRPSPVYLSSMEDISIVSSSAPAGCRLRTAQVLRSVAYA